MTIRIVRKRGQEIASALSAQTRQKIEFVPHRRYTGARYDLEMKDDDIFNALNFLSKRGNVTIDGITFEAFKNLRKQIKGGKTISP